MSHLLEVLFLERLLYIELIPLQAYLFSWYRTYRILSKSFLHILYESGEMRMLVGRGIQMRGGFLLWLWKHIIAKSIEDSKKGKKNMGLWLSHWLTFLPPTQDWQNKLAPVKILINFIFLKNTYYIQYRN